MIAKRKPAKQAEQDYQDRARALGCVVCWYRIEHGMQSRDAGQCGDTHIHHRNFNDWHGAKQLGQSEVVSLGGWHHDGVIREDYGSSEAMRETFGPSFKHAVDFREWTYDALPGYGRGTEAWQKYQDELLGEE